MLYTYTIYIYYIYTIYIYYTYTIYIYTIHWHTGVSVNSYLFTENTKLCLCYCSQMHGGCEDIFLSSIIK